MGSLSENSIEESDCIVGLVDVFVEDLLDEHAVEVFVGDLVEVDGFVFHCLFGVFAKFGEVDVVFLG